MRTHKINPIVQKSITYLAAAAAIAAATFASTAAQAQEKHESNSIKKVAKKVARATHKGAKATEYGVRKGGENVNVTTHRALGKNSVERDRANQKNYIVKPDGTRVLRNKGAK